jgi:hypothetical protein
MFPLLPLPEEFYVVVVVQPQVATKTTEQINNSGNAFFNGILMYRFIILTIGFIFNFTSLLVIRFVRQLGQQLASFA